MKKIASIAALALLTLAFTSCKKKYTCECTTTVNGVSTTASATDTEKRSKKDAKNLCEKNNGTTGTTSVSCKLK